MGEPGGASQVSDTPKTEALWRIVTGSITIVFVTILWVIGLLACLELFGALDPIEAEDGPALVWFILVSLWGGLLGVWCAERLWYRRGLAVLLGPRRWFIRDFSRGVLGVIVVGLAFTPVAWTLGGGFTAQQPFLNWLYVLPLGLVALLFQTGAEELVFRGFLQHHLSKRFRSPVLWMILPSLVFGLLHFDPESSHGANLVYVGSTALFGLAAADLTMRSGNLGAAWGLHFANNVFALMVVSYAGDIEHLSLFTHGDLETSLTDWRYIAIELAFIVSAYALIRRMIDM